MRQIKKDFLTSPKPLSVNATTGRTTCNFEVELITPMYGGGAKAGVNDQDLPIRPASVRGQLRFWWRATRGAKFNTPQELFTAEEEIWGSVDKPSSTIVKVISTPWNQSRDYIGPRDNNYGFDRFGPEAYVLFPATADTSRHNLVREGLRFKLQLSFKQTFETDVLCAVWAWVNFGGIGARTRRGCGALYCQDFAPPAADCKTLKEWLKNQVDKYGLMTAKRSWPTLSQQILVKTMETDPLAAWAESIRPMKVFRQEPGIGRNRGTHSNRPGRSRWPEPDTLRRALKRHSTAHEPNDKTPGGFPRAAFGLPIIFNFPGSRGDPNSELYPKGAKRMGSPVILRPIKAQNGQNASMAILLQTPGLDGKELELKGCAKPFGPDKVIHPSFSTYPNSPMKGRSAAGNAVEAFLQYLQETPQPGFRMV